MADEADAIAAYAHDIAAAELLLTIFGDGPATHALLDDDDFPELVLAIRHAHSAGMNVATELPRLVHTRPIELVTAASLGDHDPRLPPNPTTNGQPELMAGIVVDATVGLSDPQVLDALWKRYESIEQRADSLAEMAIESEQPWAMTTAHSARRDDSRSLLRVVAAYRERWDISGDAPLGPRPDESADRACNGRGGRNQPTARPTGRVSAAAHPRGMGESPCPHASRSTATSPPIPTSGSATPEPSWAHLRVASHERVKRNGE